MKNIKIGDLVRPSRAAELEGFPFVDGYYWPARVKAIIQYSDADCCVLSEEDRKPNYKRSVKINEYWLQKVMQAEEKNIEKLKKQTKIKVEFETYVKEDWGGTQLRVVHPDYSSTFMAVPRSVVTVIQEPIEVGDFVRVGKGFNRHGVVQEILPNKKITVKYDNSTFSEYSLENITLICKAANLEDGWNK